MIFICTNCQLGNHSCCCINSISNKNCQCASHDQQLPLGVGIPVNVTKFVPSYSVYYEVYLINEDDQWKGIVKPDTRQISLETASARFFSVRRSTRYSAVVFPINQEVAAIFRDVRGLVKVFKSNQHGHYRGIIKKFVPLEETA